MLLKDRLKRILNQNKKANTKFNLHKAMALKFRVKKIYHPKYESIEKHKPDINLNSKTKRIFPQNLMQKCYYIDNDLMSNTTINRYKEKKDKNLLLDKRNNHYICSSLSFNNLVSRSLNNYISDTNERNKYLKNKLNMKMSSFTIDENNNINIINQSINPNIKNYNNINLRKSKSQINIYEK